MTRPTDRRELLDDATDRLAAAGVASPRYDAEALLVFVVGRPGHDFAGREVAAAAQAEFRALVERRAAREPLQHLLGTTGFRYLDLEVGPGVFTPRPETEVMTGDAVAEVERRAAAGASSLRVVDLCAGSGAIGLAVVSEVEQAQVTAVELSPDAVAYAQRNAARLPEDVRSRYEIRRGDIVDAVEDLVGRVDVAVANPPYVPLTAFETVQAEARDFDPPLALWSGEDGLDAIRVVAQVAARLLVDGGLLLCEHADLQGETAPAVFAATGAWSSVRDHRDLTGRPRYVSARRVARAASPAGTMAP